MDEDKPKPEKPNDTVFMFDALGVGWTLTRSEADAMIEDLMKRLTGDKCHA